MTLLRAAEAISAGRGAPGAPGAGGEGGGLDGTQLAYDALYLQDIVTCRRH